MKFLAFFILSALNSYANGEGVALICDFEEYEVLGYGCDVKYLKIDVKNDRTITNVFGNHQGNKTNKDVKFLYSDHHKMNFFPLNLTKNFQNLNNIYINDSSMLEVNVGDFQQFGTAIEEITIQNSKIEVLEAGLFATMPNLKEISFYNNKIKHVDDGVLTNLKQLKNLWFGSNACYSGYSVDGNETAVMIISKKIEKKCKDEGVAFNKLLADKILEAFAHSTSGQ